MPKYSAGTGWTASGIGTAAVAAGNASAQSNPITNTTGELFLDVSLALTTVNPTGSPFIEWHILPLLDDGTTYADRSTATLVEPVAVTTGSSAKALVTWLLPAPNGTFRLVYANQTGQSVTPARDPQYRLYSTS